MDLKNIRQEYMQKPLEIEKFQLDPIGLLKQWYQDAIDSNISLVNAMTLSTVTEDGFPNSRVVLAKDISDKGLIIYTDYNSQKGREIEKNSNVAALIFWKEQDRQIRIKAKASKIEREESDKYFKSRPKESQISASASLQSSSVTIEALTQKVTNLISQYKDEDSLPCPKNWGGYFLEFVEIEFWQGRPNRLHDRFHFLLRDGEWSTFNRLSP